MSDLANYAEVQRALQEQAPSILEQIPVSAAQLSFPWTAAEPASGRASSRTSGPVCRHGSR